MPLASMNVSQRWFARDGGESSPELSTLEGKLERRSNVPKDAGGGRRHTSSNHLCESARCI